MPIEFKNNKFHLYNDKISYAFEIGADKDILGIHFGGRIIADDVNEEKYSAKSFQCVKMLEGAAYRLGVFNSDYPTATTPDFRIPAFEAEVKSGKNCFSFKYKEHKIIKGKPEIVGLPAVYTENENEAETLILTLLDADSGIEIDLHYSVFNDFAAICRHSVIKNTGSDRVIIKNAQSISLDKPAGKYDYIHFPGSWAREKQLRRHPVHEGEQGFESRVGSSGNIENPFMVFCDRNADENIGEAYGLSLIYSGNHKFTIECGEFEKPRIQAGINPFMFSWSLESGEEFSTPEAVMVYSDEGIGGMSRTFHRLYRSRLCRGKFKEAVRPILINNWEATYFDFDMHKLIGIAEKAAAIGIELFVLDDGWFGKRNSDTCSLGDWYANEEKLGGTLKTLAEEINKRGLEFGLWFEPEMISEDSDLYRAHPDWVIGFPYGLELQGRRQHILDFTKKEVRDYIVDTISAVLKSANITYVKWDKNRHVTTPYSNSLPADKQGEFYHRNVLGLYDVMERITSAFPDILFESCSGGGARNDAGMLYYMPQTWISDDTDAVMRQYIQYGASLVYPVSSFGSHVSAVPNHQTGRVTSLSLRGTVAMNGAFGYELDLTKQTEEDLNKMKEHVEFYKAERELVIGGDYYRLLSPYESRYSSWMYVSKDKNEALVYYAVTTVLPNNPIVRLKLRGLDKNKYYTLNGRRYSGKTLMNYGLDMNLEDIQRECFIWKLKAE